MIINVNRRPRVQHPRDASFSQHHHCRCQTEPINRFIKFRNKNKRKIYSAILLILSYFLLCSAIFGQYTFEQTQVLTKFGYVNIHNICKAKYGTKITFLSPPFSTLIYPSSVKPELCEARSGNWDISRWDFLDNVHEKLLKLKNVWICREF